MNCLIYGRPLLDISAWAHHNDHRQCGCRFQISGLAHPLEIMPNTKIQAPNSNEIQNFNIQYPNRFGIFHRNLNGPSSIKLEAAVRGRVEP
jgi:hypothetical protein